MKSILKQVKKVEITTKHLVDGLITGHYNSIFKGRGIEFSEVREYNPGDDIRSIDWNVTARMGKPYVKEFIEERDLTVYLVFDVSASNNFGSKKRKKETAIEMAASLAFAAMKNNDNVGLCLFTNQIEKFIPARKGKKHIMKVIREMLTYQPKNKTTDLTKSLNYVSKIVKKRAVVFVVSDFIGTNFLKSLKHLKRKHDVVCINMADNTELDMPDVGYILLEDEETGEQMLVNTSEPEFRKNYSQLINKQAEGLKTGLKKIGTDMIQLYSGESFDLPLRRFFKLRESRAW